MLRETSKSEIQSKSLGNLYIQTHIAWECKGSRSHLIFHFLFLSFLPSYPPSSLLLSLALTLISFIVTYHSFFLLTLSSTFLSLFLSSIPPTSSPPSSHFFYHQYYIHRLIIYLDYEPLYVTFFWTIPRMAFELCAWLCGILGCTKPPSSPSSCSFAVSSSFSHFLSHSYKINS